MFNDHDMFGQGYTHDEVCRRAFLGRSTLGLGTLAMAGLLGKNGLAAAAPAVGPEPKAKRVILVFLSGGISQLETFDEKPLLNERRGEQIPASVRNGKITSSITERQGNLALVGSAFKFKKRGQCGMNISELFPHLAKHADDLTLIRSHQTDHVLHEAAVTTLFTGTPLLGRPAWGAWLSYALGTANKNLPEFVVLLSGGERLAPLHPRLWHSGFLPGTVEETEEELEKEPASSGIDHRKVEMEAKTFWKDGPVSWTKMVELFESKYKKEKRNMEQKEKMGRMKQKNRKRA